MDDTDQEWDDSDVPESGAVFAFGKNIPEKFWIGRNRKIVQVACGEEHTCILSNVGKVYTFGKNGWGQLGTGSTASSETPMLVKGLKSECIRRIACGQNHTLVYSESMKLFGFGNNSETQIGLGLPETLAIPTQNKEWKPQEVQQLAAGRDYSALVTANGELFTWGSNEVGQLGLGEGVSSAGVPQLVLLPGPVLSVSCGHYHMGAVLRDGGLFMWGEAELGKLGLFPGEENGSETDEDHQDALTKPVMEPKEVEGLSQLGVVQVACGSTHSLALSRDGRVFAWGEGRTGQLGAGSRKLQIRQPTPLTHADNPLLRTKMIATAESHSALLLQDGTLFTFGDIRHNKLGLSSHAHMNQLQPTLVPRLWRFQCDLLCCGGCHTVVVARPVTDDSECERRFMNYRLPWRRLDVDSRPGEPPADEAQPITASYDSLLSTGTSQMGLFDTADSWQKNKPSRVQLREKRRLREDHIQLTESMRSGSLPSLQCSFDGGPNGKLVANKGLGSVKNLVQPEEERMEERIAGKTQTSAKLKDDDTENTSHQSQHSNDARPESPSWESAEYVSDIHEDEEEHADEQKHSESDKEKPENNGKSDSDEKNSDEEDNKENHKETESEEEEKEEEKSEEETPKITAQGDTKNEKPVPKSRRESASPAQSNDDNDQKKPKPRMKSQPLKKAAQEKEPDEKDDEEDPPEPKPSARRRRPKPRQRRTPPAPKKALPPPPSPSPSEDELTESEEEEVEEKVTPKKNGNVKSSPTASKDKPAEAMKDGATDPVEPVKDEEVTATTKKDRKIGCGNGNRACVIS